MARKLEYAATEKDALYLHALRNRFLRTPNVSVSYLNPENPGEYTPWQEKFDTALCGNVLEAVEDPVQVLKSVRSCLLDSGTVLVLVPQGPGLFCALDKAMGHLRRFSEVELRQTLEQSGYQVQQVEQLNKIGALAWWLYGHVLGREKMNRVSLKLFDKTVWFWRRIDRFLPGPGLTLVAVAKRRN